MDIYRKDLNTRSMLLIKRIFVHRSANLPSSWIFIVEFNSPPNFITYFKV